MLNMTGVDSEMDSMDSDSRCGNGLRTILESLWSYFATTSGLLLACDQSNDRSINRSIDQFIDRSIE